MNSFRSFEAVARHLSFSKAAEELRVTPGAISQQIRCLEELLGTRLFDRTRRSVALTDAASRMLADVQAGLELLSRAISDKTTPVGEHTLTISVAPSFASKWLLPRLTSFYESHPDIDLRVSATVGLADFKRDRSTLRSGSATATIRASTPNPFLPSL
jgi:LysR family glycine cleavage system transcriptional activator